eukprot:1747345-Pleurochrysis_carterae.AAC.1
MSNNNNAQGVEQVVKALSALENPRRQMETNIREEEELALKQIISGILPEWQETDTKKKSGSITQLKLWTGEMMNCARIHMKMWIAIKNEHKAAVQKRWDNRHKMGKAFQTWRKRSGLESNNQIGGEEDGKREIEKERTYGIKYWGRIRSVPKIHEQVRNFLQKGIG